MSAKLLTICHCERNEVERSNRKDSAITSLRYRSVRNDKCLTGHDITGQSNKFMINFNLATSSDTDTSKLSYSVLVENEQDGRFSAVVIGLSDCKSSGNTENEALENLQQLLQKRLENSKIVTLEIDSPQTDNPWTEVAGMYKDNPLFDEVLAEIEAERRKRRFLQ